MASSTRSGVIGRERIRAPTAWKMAFAMAAEVGLIAVSANPFAP